MRSLEVRIKAAELESTRLYEAHLMSLEWRAWVEASEVLTRLREEERKEFENYRKQKELTDA